MTCGKCGAEVPQGSYFCQNCGSRVLTYERYAQLTGRESAPIQPGTRNSATAMFLLTMLSLAAWLLPLFGYPVCICGIILAAKALRRRQKSALVCLIVCSLGLVLTVVNSAIAVSRAMQMLP